ncbi:MotE family protein [Paenisporosarcina cavernae]|uniref:Magnesium transporter MgtE intracellular domain-containing protein n=1 Tax=Paenisporosarcina cavernae TaxID=2320858 RepID=A0A385YUT6_9BACL|nr:MotE family protein [Paenisporosarcina cavernae]AYC29243.1 hypothetical protein D3873_04865 [Paenisporosarcina cavernae]
MAKANKKTTEMDRMPGEPKEPGMIQKLFLWIVIPILFAVAVFLIIAQFANINVFDSVKSASDVLPFISSEEPQSDADRAKVFEERVVTLQAQIQEKEAQIAKLQTTLDDSDSEKEALLIEQERLLDEIAVLERQSTDSKRDFDEIISTFEQMSSKAAAPVITNMSDAEAIRILTNVTPEVLAGILEKMTPQDAAKYTELMSKQ